MPSMLEKMKKNNPKMIDCAFRHNHDEHLCSKAKDFKDFETSQCFVKIMNTDIEFNGENLYIIVSTHKSDGKALTRFGTHRQVEQIINTYKFSRRD